MHIDHLGHSNELCEFKYITFTHPVDSKILVVQITAIMRLNQNT